MRWILLFSLTFVACASEETPLDARPVDSGAADTARPDTGTDSAMDSAVVDSAADTSFDAAHDAPVDASAVSASIKEEYLFQSCMPLVRPDPIQVKATVTLDNPTALSFGTLRASKGRFVSGGTTLATFDFPEIEIVLPAMSSASATFEKTANSAEPKSGCSTLPCTGTVQLEVLLTGAGTTITARSSEIAVECAH